MLARGSRQHYNICTWSNMVLSSRREPIKKMAGRRSRVKCGSAGKIADDKQIWILREERVALLISRPKG